MNPTAKAKNPHITALLSNKEFKLKYRKILSKTFTKYKDTKKIKNNVKQIEKSIKCLKNVLKKDFSATRDSFRFDYPIEYSQVYQLFSSFSSAKEAINEYFFEGKGDNDKELLRDDLDIHHDIGDKGYPFKIFISAIIPHMPISNEAMQTIAKWQKCTKGDFRLLLMRGTRKSDGFHSDLFKTYKDKLVTSLRINNRLIAEDFQVYPQMIIPLTGLARFGQKKHSVIIASPKQTMLSVARGKSKHPHIIYSTGSINTPSYVYDRVGRIAQQDHKIGGLIIEVKDEETFYIRNVTFDSKFGFCDLDKYYTPDGVKSTKADALILGDSHYGIEDKAADEASKRIADMVKPSYIVFHDLCDNRSICHHELNNIITKWKYPETQYTLQAELDHTAIELKKWLNRCPESQLVVLPSNHDDFIEKWLNTGLFATDRLNAKLGAELFIAMLNDKNPIEFFFQQYHAIKGVNFLKRNDGFTVNGCELNVHGDKGNNGAKGSPRGLELSYGKCVCGHSHSPFIFRDVFSVGTNCILDPDYTKGGGSSWLHADVILHANGERQLIIKINGKFNLGG